MGDIQLRQRKVRGWMGLMNGAPVSTEAAHVFFSR